MISGFGALAMLSIISIGLSLNFLNSGDQPGKKFVAIYTIVISPLILAIMALTAWSGGTVLSYSLLAAAVLTSLFNYAVWRRSKRRD